VALSRLTREQSLSFCRRGVSEKAPGLLLFRARSPEDTTGFVSKRQIARFDISKRSILGNSDSDHDSHKFVLILVVDCAQVDTRLVLA